MRATWQVPQLTSDRVLQQLLTLLELSNLTIAADSSSSGLATLLSGSVIGRLYLNANEDTELNSHLPRARDAALVGSVSNTIAAAFLPIPDMKANLHFWGLGATADIKIGTVLYAATKTVGEISGIIARWEREQA